MSRHTILIALLCLTPLVALQAQSASDSIPRRLTLGVAGGLASNDLSVEVAYATDYHYEGRSGFSGALTARYEFDLLPNKSTFLIPNVALRTDLALVQKNYTFYRMAERVSFVYTDHTNNYLSLPLMAELFWGDMLQFRVFGGFYVGGWLTGHVKGRSYSLDYLDYTEEDGTYFDEPYTFNSKRDNRFDAGWVYGLGLGLELGRMVLSYDVRWYYALTDIQKQYMLFQNPRYNTTCAIMGGLIIKL